MYAGHISLGLLAKYIFPSAHVGLLVFSSILPDLLFFFLAAVAPNIEGANLNISLFKQGLASPFDLYAPYTHSLAGTFLVCLPVLLGVMAFLHNQYPHKFPALKPDNNLFAYVATLFGHWLAEIPLHRKDLALWPGTPGRFGYGLWDYPWLSFLLESAVVVLGLLAYNQSASTSRTVRRDPAVFNAFAFFLILYHLQAYVFPLPTFNSRLFSAIIFLADLLLVVLSFRMEVPLLMPKAPPVAKRPTVPVASE